MKRIGYIACALLMTLAAGCLKNFDPAVAGVGHLIELGDGKLLGVEVPDSVKAQGRDAARAYIVTQYPAAAPFVDAVLDKVLPRPAPAGGLPQYVQIPVVWTTNVTAKLRDGYEINGSRFVSGDQLEAIFVSVKPSAALALPPEVNSQYTPGEFAAKALGPAAAAPEPPAVVPAPPPDPASPVPAGYPGVDLSDIEVKE